MSATDEWQKLLAAINKMENAIGEKIEKEKIAIEKKNQAVQKIKRKLDEAIDNIEKLEKNGNS